jgi:hypothetical protein
MSTKPHVGIIGAGVSGLRCAEILLQNGARVTILEARDRIGGRVGFPRTIRDVFAFWVVSSDGESWIMKHGALLIFAFRWLGPSGGGWGSFGGSVCICSFHSFFFKLYLFFFGIFVF